MKHNFLTSKRLLWIDVLRGFGILLVILGHTNPPFKRIIYSFHMPLFFILSGYLWNNNRKQIKYPSLLIKNVWRYLVPYAILCGINLIIEYGVSIVSHDDYNLRKYIIGILYSRGTTEWMPNCSPLWYLTAIFMAICIFDAIQKIQNKTLYYLMIGIMGISSALLSSFEVFKLPWNIDTAMMGIVFIGIGYWMNEKQLLLTLKTKRSPIQLVIIVTALTIVILSIIFNPIDMVSFDGNRYGNAILMLAGSVSMCFILFYLSYRICWKGIITRIVPWFGQHTIFIMAFDYFAGTVARVMLDKIGTKNWILLFLLRTMILVMGCILWIILVKRIKVKSIQNVLSF